MQYSIVNYKTVKENSDFRIDAEYYHPEFLKIEEGLSFKKHDILKNLISSNSRYSQPTYTENSDVKVINSQYLREDEIKYDEARSGIGKIVPYESIMICSTGVGTLGRVNINYLKNIKISVDSHVNIIQSKSINPYFLFSFLQSKYGKSQIEKNISGSSGQIEIYPRDFEKFKIIIPSISFQIQIEQIVKHAYQLLDHSKSLYSQAEELLLSELGLLDWQPKHTLAFVKNFSDTQKAERIDAEYFQPKYEEIIEAVKRYKGGFDELGNLVKIKDKNFTPKADELYKYIELANISSNGEINGYTENFGNELPSRARRKVQKGDLIISSIEGSLESIALITEDWKNALCSTGFFVVNSDKINSETLLVLLKTKVGQLQLKKGCKGTILTAIDKNELSKVVLPKIDSKAQGEIKEKITEMYKTKTLSKSLLEIAKRGVEIAIEKDEQEAERQIKGEIKKLGVEI